MSFKSMQSRNIGKFNSAVSAMFLEYYNQYLDDKIVNQAMRPSSRTFAPSSFRCNRKSWFRLRGVEPDKISIPDKILEFSAKMGTACHEMIQENLSELLGANWIDVRDYLKNNLSGNWEVTKTGYEYQIVSLDIPVKFSCDGLMKIHGDYYLLEIKSSEYSSWVDLTDPKQEHMDQIRCYAALLGLHHAIVMYIDRQYGDIKCYELTFTDSDHRDIFDRFHYVMDMVDKNLAPEGLPKGDKWCSPNMCQYYEKCQEYGR